jgi:hypothetical protein
MLISSTRGKITFIDAELGNTTINGDPLVLGVNYSLDFTNVTDNLWGWRTNRTDVNGAGVWVTDGGGDHAEFDREETAPLKIDITLPEAGILYDLYAVIMNNNTGAGYWDVAARIGDTGEFTNYNKNSAAMTLAVAADFDSAVNISTATSGDQTFKVLIGQYTPTAANETVSIYINGLDSWGVAGLDQRTRFDGLGYDVAPPSNPSPFDGETGVAVDDVTLTWEGGQDPNAAGHYVYLGTASDALTCLNPDNKLPVNTGTYSIGTIEMNTTYYWQIEVSMENGQGGYPAGDPNNIFGPVWSFSTVFSIPIITAQPSNQVVSVGGTAEFTVGVESLSTPTFEWYYSADKATDTAGDDIFLTTDQTLTVSNVSIADEGYYYCRVNNESGTEVVSSPAALAITRLVAHWTLDAADYNGTTYADVTGSGNDATVRGIPVFAGGIVDGDMNPENIVANGAVTTSDPNSTANAGPFNPSAETGEFSISAWVKRLGTENIPFNTIASKRDGWSASTESYWQFLAVNNGQLRMQSYGLSTVNTAQNLVTVGEWHHVAVTFADGIATLYVDGMPEGVGGFTLAAGADATFYIGRNDQLSERFDGTLDDVKAFNYALSAEEVVDLFYAETSTSTCLYGNPVADLNEDCQVDLSDFAIMASNWLEHGFYPVRP